MNPAPPLPTERPKKMKLLRSLVALSFTLALSLALPARAAQDSYVTPTTGPMPFGTFVSTHLNPALLALGSCHSGTTAPANGPSSAPATGQCWWDTSGGTSWVLKYYTGAAWVSTITLNTSTLQASISTTAFTGTITPAQITGDRDDYAPSESGNTIANATAVRLSSDTTRNVTGLTLGSAGKVVVLHNVGSNPIVLKNQSASSTAANRFLFAADVTLAADTPVALFYDAVSSRWRPWSRALANTGVTAGTYGSATQASQCTYDVQGRATSCSSITVTPAWGSITGTPTTLSGYGITDGQPLDASLTAFAALTTAADKCLYFSGADTPATFDCLSWARSFISAATVAAGRTALGATSVGDAVFIATNAAAARTAIGAVIGTNVQAWDTDLDCIAANSTAGLLAYTGAGTCASRTLTAPAAGFTITNPAGTAGNPTFVLANDLAALEALASTGFAVRTTTDTWAQRTMTGTANEVCITNGDGVSGNPTYGICSGFLSTAHSWAGVQTFAAPVFTGVADNQGTIKLSAFVTSTQITSNQNNYTATDGSNTCTTKLTLRISTDASRNVTGLSCGQAEGDVRIIHNVGAQSAVLTNQDAASTAANRFLFGGDMTLGADTSVTIRYDGVTSRWRAITTPGAGGGGGVSSVTVAAGNGVAVSGTCTITTSGTCTVAVDLSKLTNSLGSDVAMNNTSNYFTGPSVAQGTSGTWFASGAVTMIDTAGAAAFICKLWDGTTVIASGRTTSTGASNPTSLALSGYLATPASDIKISCRDSASTSGQITFNNSGNSKDSTLSVFRIQ